MSDRSVRTLVRKLRSLMLLARQSVGRKPTSWLYVVAKFVLLPGDDLGGNLRRAELTQRIGNGIPGIDGHQRLGLGTVLAGLTEARLAFARSGNRWRCVHETNGPFTDWNIRELVGAVQLDRCGLRQAVRAEEGDFK